jgi:hypothetical protein
MNSVGANGMNEQVIVRRTVSGFWGPISCAAGALALFAASGYSALTATTPIGPGEMKAIDLIFAAAVCAIGAVALEVQIRRQLDLARNGIKVEAIIDEVIDPRWTSRDAILAEFHFFTIDGEWTDGKCHIESIDKTALRRGARAEIFYDPANPTRHQLMLRMWGVEWEMISSQCD